LYGPQDNTIKQIFIDMPLITNSNISAGSTNYSYVGPLQYGGMVFPRGQVLFSNTNTQNQLYLSSNAYTNAGGVFAYRNSSQPATFIGQDNGVISMGVASSGTADGVISWTTPLTVNTSGVKFQNGSSYLNNYEEGSWTPQLVAGATSFTMGGINAGKYIRIGNQVTVCGHIQWSAGVGSGMVKIDGLPFASSGVRTAGSIGAVSSGISFSSGYGQWILVNDPGYTFIYIIQQATGGSGYSHTPPVSSSGIIYGFSLTYFIL
jgi:hypothetical protein